jgi:hypothetical protein
MTRTTRLAALAVTGLLVLAASSVGVAGQTTTQAAPEQNATETEATEPVQLDTCATINESGEYVLTDAFANVTANQSTGLATDGGAVEGCVVVQSSDVILDGDGTTVDGPTTFENRNLTLEPAGNDTGAVAPETVGLVVHDPNGTVSNVTVRDVSASDWYWGVAVVDASNVTVSDVGSDRNVVGIELVNVTNATLENASGLG